MGHKKLKKKEYPFVSICTPTFNRRPFIPMMLECFRHQTYPKDKMEWIIIDDGTDPVEDIIMSANIPQIRYFRYNEKMTLGRKRNMMHEKVHAQSRYIVYFDDDDYYPPERVEHAVDTLQKNPKALCVGSSAMYLYFKHIQKMYKFGPYGPNHATAASFAFRKEMLKNSAYENDACLAEEKAFLKNYTVPFAQLDPKKTILVFSHPHNSFDKKRLLENPSPQFVRETPEVSVGDFIQNPEIYQFFMEKIDKLLEEYDAGSPDLKPDVKEHMAKLEEDRKKQYQTQQQQQQKIVLTKPDGGTLELSMEQTLQMLNLQRGKIAELEGRVESLESLCELYRKKLAVVKSDEVKSEISTSGYTIEDF